MKTRHWVAALAVLGMVGFTTAPAMAGPGCGSKTSKASSSCSSAKAKQASAACTKSKASCGAKTTTASNDACCPSGSKTTTAMKNCNYTAEECAEWMRAHYETHGWLGIEMNMDAGNPVVTKVVPESPAHEAGFETGDELTSINGIGFSDHTAIQELMKNGFKIGDTVVY
ncbi:MAG: PDZ domain-containing protein, partial [Candidatus Eisenbacteria bacterium]|nr:PDZ domain-containing protein [Candidatus Latescibacterota bacterium]MBD3303245.1 PDZ domain-containing protein [Candidatus Eisenbacteria bacterium]